MTSNKIDDVAMDESDGKNREPSSNTVLNQTSEMKDVKNLCTNTIKSVQINSPSNEGEPSVNTGNNEPYKPMPIKKKHRRGSRRSKKKYKPYSKLTWEEKQAVEERDSRRAVSIRQKYMHEKGRPLAPFNTSQFLMAEHDTQEPDLHVHVSHSRTTRLSSSADDSDEAESSLSDEERDIEDVRNFLQKDFAETYDRFHSETLRRMNKEQLINEYMQLEDKVECLERELASIKANGKINGYATSGQLSNGRGSTVNSAIAKTSQQDLESEINKLREENQRLNAENSFLRPVPIEKGISSV